MSGAWKDTRTQDQSDWDDVAAKRNQQDISDYRGGNPAWRSPEYQKGSPHDAPGHTRMFHDDPQWGGDKPNRSFVVRKRHGWWGKEEYYDQNGRKVG